MLRGIGIDLVTVSRIETLIARHGDRFKNKLFTLAEQAYCDGYAKPAQHYAARFAAKEAILKALGVPKGLRWHELEVCALPTQQPTMVLHGAAKAAAAAIGATLVLLSLTHEGDTAAAVVALEG